MAGVGDLLAKEPLSHSGAQSAFPLNPWISTGYGPSKYVLNGASGERETRLRHPKRERRIYVPSSLAARPTTQHF